MSDSSVFYELTKTITEKERTDLLSKIKSSIQFEDDDEDHIYHKEMEQTERDSLIEYDIKNAGFFTKLILWFKTRFLGKRRKELFIQLKIKQLKRYINRKTGGLTGFETRDLTPKLAEYFWEVYTAILPVRDMFKKFWMKQKELEVAYTVLIETNLDGVVKQISDILPNERSLEIYTLTGKKDSIKNEILLELDNYIETVSNSYFEEIAEGLLPFYYLKEIILFPYTSFFQLFHFIPLSDGEEQRPSFKKASAMLAIDYLEKMHYALHALRKISVPISIDHNFVHYITESFLNPEEKVSLVTEEDDQEAESEDKVKDIIKNLMIIIERGKQFQKHVPLAEMIKYFIKDPYFKIVFYVPKLDLKDFYQTILKVKLLGQLDSKYEEIRRLYIDKEIERIFHGIKLQNFLNYREYATLDHQKMGLPFFSHIKSLHLLFNFVKFIYPGSIQEAIQILSRSLITQNRVVRDKLISYALIIEDLEEKIKQFDFSMSSDSEDGKLFQKLRFSLSDTSHQKIYRSLITQKDREVKDIIDKGIDSLFGLQKVFEEVLSATSQNIRIQLKSHFFVQGRATRLHDIVESRIRTLRDFTKLLTQIIKMERF